MDKISIKSEPVDRPNLKDLYLLAVKTREHELNLFWQRSNYLLVLNSAAVGVFFTSKAYLTPGWSILFTVFGIIFSWFWFRLVLGGKYWQIRWEAATERFENLCAPDARLFAATREEMDKAVAGLIAKNERHWAWERWIDKEVQKKPSPSGTMANLAASFVVLWVALTLLSIYVTVHGDPASASTGESQRSSTYGVELKLFDSRSEK